jgi:hypothetical protein
MMADVEHLIVFQGVKRSGNTRSGLAQAINAGERTKAHIPMGCEDNRPGSLLAPRSQPVSGMLPRSRLDRGPWLARLLLRIRYGFPQRPQCDFDSGSL